MDSLIPPPPGYTTRHGRCWQESYLDLDLIFLLFLFSLLIRFFLHFALILL